MMRNPRQMEAMMAGGGPVQAPEEQNMPPWMRKLKKKGEKTPKSAPKSPKKAKKGAKKAKKSPKK